MTMSDRAKLETKWMDKEREALKVAFIRCTREASSSGVDVGLLWVMWLERRASELECQKAETMDWMARAIAAVEDERKGS